MKMRLLVCTMVVAMFAFTGTPFAQSKIEIKLATIAPKGTPWTAHVEKWRENLLKASNGNIEIKIFPSGQLGNEFDVLKQVKRGRITAGGFSAAPLNASFPELALMGTPFLIDKVETHDCIYDTQLSNEFSAVLEKQGFKLLQWQDGGSVQIYAQEDLSDPASAKGYKIRVALHPISRLLWSSVGANGIELPYVETPAALQTGMVRGGESARLSYFAFGISKIAPHLMLTNHWHQAGAILINLNQWNKYSSEQQKTIMNALPDVNEQRQSVRKTENALMEKYIAAGGQVHELTAEQRDAWKKLVEPNWPKFVKELGPEAEAMWPKILKAKKACE